MIAHVLKQTERCYRAHLERKSNNVDCLLIVMTSDNSAVYSWRVRVKIRNELIYEWHVNAIAKVTEWLILFVRSVNWLCAHVFKLVEETNRVLRETFAACLYMDSDIEVIRFDDALNLQLNLHRDNSCQQTIRQNFVRIHLGEYVGASRYSTHDCWRTNEICRCSEVINELCNRTRSIWFSEFHHYDQYRYRDASSTIWQLKYDENNATKAINASHQWWNVDKQGSTSTILSSSPFTCFNMDKSIEWTSCNSSLSISRIIIDETKGILPVVNLLHDTVVERRFRATAIAILTVKQLLCQSTD
jgi:hypothetical protein